MDNSWTYERSESPAALVAASFIQIGETLSEVLAEATTDPKLRQLVSSLAEAIRTIAYKVQCERMQEAVKPTTCSAKIHACSSALFLLLPASLTGPHSLMRWHSLPELLR
jgi:hypothetical protein